MEIMTEKAWRARQDAIAAVVRMAKRHGWAVPPMADLDLDEIEGIREMMEEYLRAGDEIVPGDRRPGGER